MAGVHCTYPFTWAPTTRALVPGAPAPCTRATRESPLSLVLNPLHQVTIWCKPSHPCTSLVTGAQLVSPVWCRWSLLTPGGCLVYGVPSPSPEPTWCSLARRVFCFTQCWRTALSYPTTIGKHWFLKSCDCSSELCEPLLWAHFCLCSPWFGATGPLAPVHTHWLPGSGATLYLLSVLLNKISSKLFYW